MDPNPVLHWTDHAGERQAWPLTKLQKEFKAFLVWRAQQPSAPSGEAAEQPALDWPQMLLPINAYASHMADAAQHQAASRADISHAAALKALADIRMAMAAHTSRWQALVHELIWRAAPQAAPAPQAEPVAEVNASWNDDEGFMLVKRLKGPLPAGTMLYAQAVAAQPAPTQAEHAPTVQPLTDEQIKDCLVKAHCFGSVRLTYDSGPYEVTSPTVDAIRLAGVIVTEFCRLSGITATTAKG